MTMAKPGDIVKFSAVKDSPASKHSRQSGSFLQELSVFSATSYWIKLNNDQNNLSRLDPKFT